MLEGHSLVQIWAEFGFVTAGHGDLLHNVRGALITASPQADPVITRVAWGHTRDQHLGMTSYQLYTVQRLCH